MKRCRLNRNDFETIKIIGRGAFGEGRLLLSIRRNTLFFLSRLSGGGQTKK